MKFLFALLLTAGLLPVAARGTSTTIRIPPDSLPVRTERPVMGPVHKNRRVRSGEHYGRSRVVFRPTGPRYKNRRLRRRAAVIGSSAGYRR